MMRAIVASATRLNKQLEELRKFIIVPRQSGVDDGAAACKAHHPAEETTAI